MEEYLQVLGDAGRLQCEREGDLSDGLFGAPEHVENPHARHVRERSRPSRHEAHLLI